MSKDITQASAERPCTWVCLLKVHYPGFGGAYGLTFHRLLSMPLFSVHQLMSKMSHRFISHSFTHPVSLHVPCNLVTRVPFPLSNYPNALYLFTRSDLKTIVLPVVCLPLILIPRILNHL
jgi:hypothetical protein